MIPDIEPSLDKNGKKHGRELSYPNHKQLYYLDGNWDHGRYTGLINTITYSFFYTSSYIDHEYINIDNTLEGELINYDELW